MNRRREDRLQEKNPPILEYEKRRDADRARMVNRALRASGWSVIRVWESDLRKTPDRCLQRIVKILEQSDGRTESR